MNSVLTVATLVQGPSIWPVAARVAAFSACCIAAAVGIFGGLAVLSFEFGLPQVSNGVAVMFAVGLQVFAGHRASCSIRSWVVPRGLLDRHVLVGPAVFGLALGAGVVTVVPTVLFWAVLVFAVLGSSGTALLCGLGFGTGRVFPVVAGAGYSLAGRPASEGIVLTNHLVGEATLISALWLGALLMTRA